MPRPQQRSPFHWIRVARILLVLGVAAYGVYTAQQRQNAPPLNRGGPVAVEPRQQPADNGVGTKRIVVENVAVRYEDQGRIITWRGDVDLTATIARIRRGERLPRWENDGTTFGNHEKHLPPQRRGYYQEWVHPTPQAPGPGPQRVISGANGELWYTPDHYESFIELEGVSAKSR